MKVKVLEWKGYCTWHWDLASASGSESNEQSYVEELCGICRVSFDGACPNCKYPGDECPVILGSGCTHNFHLHCMLKWLEQESSKGLCPMCRQIFTFTPLITQNESVDEYVNLKTLIDGHKVMRERVSENSEFESDGQFN
ncbi:APC11 [Candida pseudojiufengensis]|uniref:APC11 n=1 Tax=Candida pseudojiufengensis TaxID=497109 RepID=UPI002224BD02|nr:APC11 [Candida pseudojiufengensis]KAI5961823.1 APC11 [Candida pseudojiufengensis]